MSPVAMPVALDSQFGPFLEALKTAPTAPGEYLQSYKSSFVLSPTHAQMRKQPQIVSLVR